MYDQCKSPNPRFRYQECFACRASLGYDERQEHVCEPMGGELLYQA